MWQDDLLPLTLVLENITDSFFDPLQRKPMPQYSVLYSFATLCLNAEIINMIQMFFSFTDLHFFSLFTVSQIPNALEITRRQFFNHTIFQNVSLLERFLFFIQDCNQEKLRKLRIQSREMT